MVLAIIIISFILVILLHEIGHMTAARIFDVKTNEFSIGMGPRLLSKQIGSTRYSLRLFPLGGSCDIDEKGLDELVLWKRVVVFAAGCIINFCLGNILISLGLILYSGVIQGLSKAPYAILALWQSVFIQIPDIFGNFHTSDINGMLRVTNEMSTLALEQSSPVCFIIICMGVMSIIIGLFNLIPLPPLDGGLIAVAVLERFAGKHERIKNAVAACVWVTVIFMVFLAALDDILYIAGVFCL